MEGFKNSLINNFNFSLAEWEVTKNYFVVEEIKAKDHFLRVGQISNKLGFLKTGLLRSYCYDEEGREVTKQFYQRGSVIISVESFNSRTPSQEYIMAYEDSAIITITYDKLNELYTKVTRWQGICKSVADIKNSKLLDRTNQLQTHTAQKKYQTFCKENPELIMKVPLGHIASYLGMDIATLSRIRGKK